MPALDSTNAKKRIYHQTFVVRKGDSSNELVRHTLLVNPEDMSFSEPAKVTATETLGGGYISDFGSAFKTVTLQGITGYHARSNAEGVLRDGFTEIMHFRNEVYRNFIEASDPTLSMYWYNWEDDDYWRIQPTNFRLMRNKNEPILYRYEFTFTCLNQVTAGSPSLYARIPPITLPSLGGALGSALSGLSEMMNKLPKLKKV